MSDEKQVREVTRVKNHIHGFIQEPIKVAPDQKIGEVMERIADRGYGFSTFPVVDAENKLLGLLPGRVVKALRRTPRIRGYEPARPSLHTDRKRDYQEPNQSRRRIFYKTHGYP